MIEKYRLTTLDNPFNPFTEWDQWFFFDMSQGYNTCERIASKIGMVSSELPYPIYNQLQEEAMDELIEVGAISKKCKLVGYKKVRNPDYKESEYTEEEGN